MDGWEGVGSFIPVAATAVGGLSGMASTVTAAAIAGAVFSPGDALFFAAGGLPLAAAAGALVGLAFRPDADGPARSRRRTAAALTLAALSGAVAGPAGLVAFVLFALRNVGS